eukprot:97017-Rhodomonas_salina.1
MHIRGYCPGTANRGARKFLLAKPRFRGTKSPFCTGLRELKFLGIPSANTMTGYGEVMPASTMHAIRSRKHAMHTRYSAFVVRGLRPPCAVLFQRDHGSPTPGRLEVMTRQAGLLRAAVPGVPRVRTPGTDNTKELRSANNSDTALGMTLLVLVVVVDP